MYSPNLSHRNGNPRKSQWSIQIPEEISCFTTASTNGWILQNEGWGLHYPDGTPSVLGRLAGNTKITFIAKFVTSRNATPQAAWHGYTYQNPSGRQFKSRSSNRIAANFFEGTKGGTRPYYPWHTGGTVGTKNRQ